MKTISNDFKQALTKFGRQYKNIIDVYDNLLLSSQDGDILLTENNMEIIAKTSAQDVAIEINDENIYSIKLITKGELLSTLMKELDFESSINLDVGSMVDYKTGLKVNELTGEYEYLDFGKFIIYKKEFNQDTKNYNYICYDLMLKTMVNVGNEFSFQGTVFGNLILPKICEILAIDFDDSVYDYTTEEPTDYGSIKNLQYEIDINIVKQNKMTYRDLLNIFCQYFGVSMYMDNNELKIKLLGSKKYDGEDWYIDNTDPIIVDTISKDFMKDKNVIFKSLYGPINAMTITGTDETTQKYIENTQSIEANGITLFEIKNNLLFSNNEIWEQYKDIMASNIFSMVDDVTFQLCDFSTTGILYLEWLDYFNVVIDNNTYKCLFLNSEITIKQGINEDIYTELPEKNVSEYTTTPKSDDVIADTIRARGNAYANGERLIQESELNAKINYITTYSTSERQVGVWINKPLYRKILPISSLPNAQVEYYVHGINNLDIITNIYGFANTKTGPVAKINLPYINTAEGFQEYAIGFDTYDDTYITIKCGIDRSNFEGSIVLEYTKTTD